MGRDCRDYWNTDYSKDELYEFIQIARIKLKADYIKCE